nr:MAG TPA: hypothetical protein [Caudoviricetes sp.]
MAKCSRISFTDIYITSVSPATSMFRDTEGSSH